MFISQYLEHGSGHFECGMPHANSRNMIFPARCDDRLGYVFRTHLLHRPSQFGHQLEMIKQMALGRQIDAVGGLPWRLD